MRTGMPQRNAAPSGREGGSAAAVLMRHVCLMCGGTVRAAGAAASTLEGHDGLTRLRIWPKGLDRPARGVLWAFHVSRSGDSRTGRALGVAERAAYGETAFTTHP